MNDNQKQRIVQQAIPGAGRREQRFAEVEHAEHAGQALRRLAAYFVHEKKVIFCMIAVVICGTLCGIYAPSLQSNAIDIIAGERIGNLLRTVLLMLALYLL